MNRIATCLLLLLCLGAPPAAAAADDAAPARPGEAAPPPKKRPTELAELTIEELMDVEVTSVSKKAEKLSRAAAAIHVITQEDIRRSGAPSLAEALRTSPGTEVARLDANRWAITTRGFNDEFANKLLVLADGRSVYTPLFSGVYWDVQDTLLEDIDRIEVIRGPAGTLWGANAVNGVINVITRRAKDTQGLLLTGGGGSEERGFGGARYGGKLGDAVHFRAYAKINYRENSKTATGEENHDRWHAGRGGFRVDADATDADLLTLQGDLYGGRKDQHFFNLPSLAAPFAFSREDSTDFSGGNVIGRWSHRFSDRSDLKLQLYYDRTTRRAFTLDQDHDTFDSDFQHRFALGESQEVIWGAGYRVVHDRIGGTFNTSYAPDRRTTDLVSAFAQDEVRLAGDWLTLTLGSKFEHNDFTGFEFQPSIRSAARLSDRHTLWAAVSRAVRTPSRTEDDVRLALRGVPGTPPVLAAVMGDHGFLAEELLAFELGYRARPLDPFSVDVAAFYNLYDHLRTFEPGAPFPEASPPPPHVVVPFIAANDMSGDTYGVEVAARWRPADWWRLDGTYSFLRMELRLDDGSRDTISEDDEGNSPRHQFSVRSSMDLPGGLELDLGARYVDPLSTLGVPSYFLADVRLGVRPLEGLEISIVAQNLFDGSHPEFFPSFIAYEPAEIEHGVFGRISWRF